jgi:hypothetical protein
MPVMATVNDNSDGPGGEKSRRPGRRGFVPRVKRERLLALA